MRTSYRALHLLCVALLVFQLGCKEQSYVRPPKQVALGKPAELLFPLQHVRDVAILVIRDERGWAALGTNCSHDGCDLTFQNNGLICPCCHSEFALEGKVTHGPAKTELKWYQVFQDGDLLIADTGKEVPAAARFTTPELEHRVAPVRARLTGRTGGVGVKTREVLKGQSDGEEGPMFKDFVRDSLEQNYKIPAGSE